MYETKDVETKNNKNLEGFYDSVFEKGEENHFTSQVVSKTETEEAEQILLEGKWDGKTILDVGCGTGNFVNLVSTYDCYVKGIDFSQTAINLAKTKYKKNNILFEKIDIQTEEEKLGKFDVITCIGTLEHMDNPLNVLKILKSHIVNDGKMIVTSPNWSNPRGHMLMTLYFLFDAPITLADLHYFSPTDFNKFASELNMNLEWRTIDNSWAYGEVLIKDFKRRIPNVLKDMHMKFEDEKLEKFLKWIDDAVIPFDNKMKHTGATGLYVFSNK